MASSGYEYTSSIASFRDLSSVCSIVVGLFFTLLNLLDIFSKFGLIILISTLFVVVVVSVGSSLVVT